MAGGKGAQRSGLVLNRVRALGGPFRLTRIFAGAPVPDISQPVALMLAGNLHFLEDKDEPGLVIGISWLVGGPCGDTP